MTEARPDDTPKAPLEDFEFFKESRSPEELLERAIGQIFQTAERYKAVAYLNEPSARRAMDALAEYIKERLVEVGEFGTIPVTLSGEGVNELATTIEQYQDPQTGRKGFAVFVDEKAAVRPLQLLETREGRIDGPFISLVKTEDETFKIAPFLMASLDNPEMETVTLDTTPVSIGHLMLGKRAIINLDSRSGIEVTELTKAREKYRLDDLMTDLELDTTLFSRYLNNLQRALRAERGDYFIDLQKPRLLRRLGGLAAEEATRSEAHAAVVSEAILLTLGRHRAVEARYSSVIGGEFTVPAAVSGRLIDVVVTSDSPADEAAKLIVEGYLNGSDESETHYVPLQSINGFRF